jgi:hypothetical protein
MASFLMSAYSTSMPQELALKYTQNCHAIAALQILKSVIKQIIGSFYALFLILVILSIFLNIFLLLSYFYYLNIAVLPRVFGVPLLRARRFHELAAAFKEP